jgi:pimeloyl-ACP methyl ester carboxylesterase
MKQLLLPFFLVLPFILLAQQYDRLIDHAETLFQQKNYPAALDTFKIALTDTVHAGRFDLYYGAKTAMYCNDQTLALRWLALAGEKGLGTADGETAAVRTDSSWQPLYDDPAWARLLKKMDSALAARQASDKHKRADWLTALRADSLPPAAGHRFSPPRPGYALYFSQADTVAVPYLVHVPSSVQPGHPLTAIVYLHGGVASHDDFDYQDPNLANEPVFTAADSLHALVVYPFAKKTFGWLDQKAAFEQVLKILQDAASRYSIAPQHIYMVGMSNGGSACFWFAARHKTPFAGFLALSPLPMLNIGDIDFSRITRNNPLYSVNAKDDEVFSYSAVHDIYEKEAPIAKGWHFRTLETGSHGFIYGQGGAALMLRYLREMTGQK